MQAIDASENVDFNLHTHVECNSPLLPDSKTIVISTHALTWSATSRSDDNPALFVFQLTHSRGVRQMRQSKHSTNYNFNSRTHVECDTDTNTHVASSARFQLTHSRGVRPAHAPSSGLHQNFNSRTHVECDNDG